MVSQPRTSKDRGTIIDSFPIVELMNFRDTRFWMVFRFLCFWRWSEYTTPIMLMWFKDYLELKATEKQQTQEELMSSPYLPKRRTCACMLSRVWLFVTPWTVDARLLCHRIFLVSMLEWVAISSSMGSSLHRVQTHICVPCIGRHILYRWATWKAKVCLKVILLKMTFNDKLSV